MPETGGGFRIGVALAIAAVPSTALAVVLGLPSAATGSIGASSTVTVSETPTESPSQTPTDTSSPTAQPTGTLSLTPSQSPSASPSPSAQPTVAGTPTTGAPTLDPSASASRPAAVRAILTADAARLRGLVFVGIAVHETAAGEVRALRLFADEARFDNLRVGITQAGRTFRTASGGTTVLSADVVMDVTLFRATLSGVAVEFTPEAPLPLALLLPVMEFADVEIHVVQVDAGQVTLPEYSQSLVS